MSYSTIRNDPSYLFTIRFRLSSGWVTMRVWEAPAFDAKGNRVMSPQTKLDCELSQNGKVIFPKGATYCGVSPMHSIDGIEARELVCSLFAMKPGDTDEEFFASYTPEQLAWVEQNGEELDMLKQDRYCDPETGEVRRSA